MTIRVLLLFFLLIYVSTILSCRKDEMRAEIYLEGYLIPGTEQYFPMGFYNAAELTPKLSPDGKLLAYKSADELTPRGLWVLDLQNANAHYCTLMVTHQIGRQVESVWHLMSIHKYIPLDTMGQAKNS